MKNKLLYFAIPALVLMSSCDLENFISPDNEAKVFNVTFPSGHFTAATQDFSVGIECDIRWAAGLTSGKWASIADVTEDGIVTSPFTIHLSSNRTDESRSDTLVVTAGSVVKTFPIVQDAITSIISSREVELNGTAPVKVTVNAMEKWSSELLGKAEWLEINPTSGDPGIVDVSIRAKESFVDVGSRSASIRFTVGSDIVGVSVTQIQTDTIRVASDTVSLSWKGGNFEVATESNIEYEVSSDVEWISPVPLTRGLNLATESFVAGENVSQDAREGNILFRSGDIEQTVKVIQNGKDPMLLITAVGIYSLAGEDILFGGKIQMSRLFETVVAEKYSVRFLDPVLLKVDEVSDIPINPSEGMSYEFKLTRYSFGNDPVSSLLEMVNIYSDGKLSWFRSADGVGLIVK